MTDVLTTLKNGQSLSVEKSEQLLTDIFDEKITRKNIKNVLTLMANRGETVDEIVGFAKTMRKAMLKVPNVHQPSIDICGTGGTGKDRFNISTASAFVLASMGVTVAKHGNYGSKKGNGSFNFLESLGINVNLTPEEASRQLQEKNATFLFARLYHPAMKIVAPIRKEIGRRTIFNCLGPLCNPAQVSHQIVGTYSLELAKKLAQAFIRLGQRALVVVGADGLDECAVSGDNILFDIQNEKITESIFNPNSLNINQTPYPCGDAEQNAQLFKEVFSVGNSGHPLSQHVALNSGVALWCLSEVGSIEEGYKKAIQQIQSRSPWVKVNQFLSANKYTNPN